MSDAVKSNPAGADENIKQAFFSSFLFTKRNESVAAMVCDKIHTRSVITFSRAHICQTTWVF